MTTVQEHAMYQVGLKVLVWRADGKFLILRQLHQSRKLFDLPGGRINADEHQTKLLDILDREIKEELGESFKVKILQPAFQFRRHFPQVNYSVFITVYEAEYLQGDIELLDGHEEYQWTDPASFEFSVSDFFHPEEYDAFKKYFAFKR